MQDHGSAIRISSCAADRGALYWRWLRLKKMIHVPGNFIT